MDVNRDMSPSDVMGHVRTYSVWAARNACAGRICTLAIIIIIITKMLGARATF